MTNYGSHQEQVTGGLPQSLVEVASGGGGLAVSVGFVYAFADPANPGGSLIGWTTDGDMSVTSNNASLEAWLDLSDVTQVRIVALVGGAGPTGATVGFHYSTDGATFADDLTSPALALPFDATGWQDSGWQDIVAGAQGSVYLRPWGAGGDGSTFASANPFYLQFK